MTSRERPYYYKLELGRFPVPCSWYEAGVLLSNYHGRCVAHDMLASGHRISTAFLVFDHNVLGNGPPVLWNTIVTDPRGNERIYGRYSTFEEALEGHTSAVSVINLLG